ncbi:MAG TPA: hypothetical protein VN774_08415 [Candidatus Limnocylindrales bacterium]|nr:hypothetical protein [Candidatus Limnocylindrales bacterium]
MRDWRAMVEEKLIGLGLPPTQHQETVREVAAHMEDRFEQGLARGLDDSGACELALKEVDDWRQLSRRIRRSKQQEGQVNYRTRALWLPGLASLTATMGALTVITMINLEPRIYMYGSLAFAQMYERLLMVLPAAGALGAYLSRRANGDLKVRLAAASFPAFVILSLFCPAIIVAGVLEHHLTWGVLPVAFALMVFNWILIPCACLLLGALPFLRNSQIREQGLAQ